MTAPTPTPRFGEGLGFAARRLPRRRLAEEEAAAAAHALHQPAAAGAGGDLSEEPLPRHEYARRDRRVDQPHRGPRAGTQPRRCPPPPPSPPLRASLSRAAQQAASETAACALPAPSSDPKPDVPRPGPLPPRPSFHQPPISSLPPPSHPRRSASSPWHYLWSFSSPLLDPLLLPSPPPQCCHPRLPHALLPQPVPLLHHPFSSPATSSSLYSARPRTPLGPPPGRPVHQPPWGSGP